MTKTILALGALGGALLVAATTALPASAAIKCQGRDQWNSAAGAWIATPYCEDNLIAAVARYHGMNVSNVAVRQNPNIKEEACHFAGHDTRIRDLCAQFLPGNDHYRR